jgi:hypothetical protein
MAVTLSRQRLAEAEVCWDVVEVTLPDGRSAWADGLLDGLPVWKWGNAPMGLLTDRQLAAEALRINGQDPVGLILWHKTGCGPQLAELYDVNRAAEIRPMTPGRWRTVEAMLAARRRCSVCGPVDHYTRFGVVDGTRRRFCSTHFRDDRCDLDAAPMAA